MATQQSTKTVTLSGTFSSGPSGLVPAAPTQSIEGSISNLAFPSHQRTRLTKLQISPFHLATRPTVSFPPPLIPDILLTHADGKVKLTILLGIVIPILGITLAWLLFKTVQLRFHWETEEMRRQDEAVQLSGPGGQSGDGGSGQQPVTGAELVALVATGRCPEGFEWRRNGDRYICAGGGHDVPVAEL